MVDAVIFAIIALVLFEEGVFLVVETVFIFRVLFSRIHVLIEEAIVALGLFGNAVRFPLMKTVILQIAVVLRLLNLGTVLEMSPIHSIHAQSVGAEIARL